MTGLADEQREALAEADDAPQATPLRTVAAASHRGGPAPDVELPVDEEVAALLASVSGGDEADLSDARAEVERLFERDSRRALFGLMRQARRLNAQVNDAEAYAITVRAEVERANEPRRRSLAFLEGQIGRLAEELLPEGSKHVDVPGAGRVQYRDYKATVRIAEPDEFIRALGADELPRLVEMRPHVKVAEAKKYAEEVLAESGEVLPGVERVEARRTATVDYQP